MFSVLIVIELLFLFMVGFWLSDYKAASLSKATFEKYNELDAMPEMFAQVC